MSAHAERVDDAGDGRPATVGTPRPRRYLRPALAGVVFALVLLVEPGQFDLAPSAILVAAAVVYVGAAAVGSRRSAWAWFLATGVPLAVDQLTGGAVDATAVLLGAAAALLLLGGVRRQRHAATHPSLVPVQLAAAAGFAGLAAAGALIDARAGAVLVAAGLLGHAAWDWHHFRSRQVVTRPYAMFCLTLDAALAAGVLVTAF
jgi:hypothetical protein